MLTPKSELAKLCIRVLPLALGLQACASKSGQRSGQGLASGAPAKPAANGRAAAPKPRQLDEAVDAYMRAATAHDAASARSLFERAIRLFEAATGERARLTFTGPLGVPLESLTYTPEGELVGIGRGVILRISSKDLWTLRRWQPLENTFRAQLIASSPDGGLAAYSDFESGRYTITLFDTRTAERRFELEGRSTAPGADVLWPYARAISFLPDGARLACASDGGRISFWDLASRSEVGHFVAPVNGFAFSHDGRLLATGEDILAYVRAADTGAPVHELGKHTSGVGALAFSRDDKVLYTADNAGWVRLWDPRSGRLLRRIAAHRNFVVHGIIPLDDNQRFVTTSRDGTALLWHRKRDKPVVVVKRSAGITAATLTSNQQALVTASSDGTLRVSDLASGREQRQLLHLVVAPTALAFPSNDRLVIATANGANTLDLSSGAWARVKGLPERIAALARSASGGVVALTEGFTLSTYERDADGYRSGAATQLKPLPMFHEVPSVLPRDVEQAGDTLAALAGNALYVWKGVGRELSFRAVSYDATDLGLARDGSAAALAFPDHVKLISIPSGGVIFEQIERDSKNKRQPGFAAVALSSDGQEVVAARGNGELLV
ncbi:MAG TPA: hypothetical protein VGJ84_02420, partial [Polyangiaceae bacterium]